MVNIKNIYNLNLLDLIKVLWNALSFIIFVSFLTSILVFIYALSVPNSYKASALVITTSQSDSGSNLASRNRYTSIANLTGINLNSLSSGTDKETEGLEVIKSRKFITDFIDTRDIMINLMAVKSWNNTKNELLIDNNLFDEQKQQWIKSPAGKGLNPSMQQAHKHFLKNNLGVSKDIDTGLITISIKHASPYVAKQWVNWIVEDLNLHFKNQDIKEAEEGIKYLREQLKTTSLSSLQKVFYSLIEERTKIIMLAKGRNEYLFRTIDPAVVPEQKYSPSRIIWTILGGLLGLCFSIILVLICFILGREPTFRLGWPLLSFKQKSDL